ncbi:MAG TPA: hypothetical protein VFE47_26320 [Tepidisphaeraceae bacterium]|jgi:hypothetical protein|nr:hypothetical protein [Tepidisphaeraceae bacterium]
MPRVLIATGAEFPDDNDRKADRFFAHAKTVADLEMFDYAIEMYIQGLMLAPRGLSQHRALQKLSLTRKAAGGRPMGIFDIRKYPTNLRDSKQSMLNAERRLASDPDNSDLVRQFHAAAKNADFSEIIWWIWAGFPETPDDPAANP